MINGIIIQGLDLVLLSHLDLKKYPIDMICVEAADKEEIAKLMKEKGYRLLGTTEENEIYVI